ncbi:hypothetical protein MLD38_031461 [Melastoma candidum]|uniref:Uncharacterized protein n=1 Tax=Melastoma candidum TaxID=119954 RepID=A0ACB9MRB9_9MYRT|nr:hypothetical protein MLD38_031461 [Melastoma candidum]
MQTLDDPWMYKGNPLLCADFLPRKCHPRAQATPPLPEHPGRQDVAEDRLEKFLAYAAAASGFACGFWGVIWSLVLNKGWRKAWFAFSEQLADGAYVAVAVKVGRLKRWLGSSSSP